MLRIVLIGILGVLGEAEFLLLLLLPAILAVVPKLDVFATLHTEAILFQVLILAGFVVIAKFRHIGSSSFFQNILLHMVGGSFLRFLFDGCFGRE